MSQELLMEVDPRMYVTNDAPVIVRVIPIAKPGNQDVNAWSREKLEFILKEYYAEGYKLVRFEYMGENPDAIQALIVLEKVDAA